MSSIGNPSENVSDRVPGELAVSHARLPDASVVTRCPNTFVATVDRIVDGAHVVLLLEDDGELVEQHVAPREELPDVDEGDELVVVISGEELVSVREIDTSAVDRLQERFDRLADSFDG